MCLLAAPRLPGLVALAVYTNLYVPFNRLNAEILGPLEQEIQGMQAFRSPTQVDNSEFRNQSRKKKNLSQWWNIKTAASHVCFQEELRKAGSMCPVCLEEMHVCRITPCGHVFHAHCLRQCLTRSTACPYCRAKILWDHGGSEIRTKVFISSNSWKEITEFLWIDPRKLDVLPDLICHKYQVHAKKKYLKKWWINGNGGISALH